MRVDQFRKRARRRATLMGAGATGLTLLLAGAAQAQDAQPTVYSSAVRYDGAGRPVGTIAPDPDGAGPLRHVATRTSYNAMGQKVKVEKGELSVWQPTSVAPNAWPGFTILETQDFAYDVMGRLVRTRGIGSDGQPAAVTDTNYDRAGRSACTAARMNPAAFAALPANACFLGTTGAQGPDRITRNYYDAVGQLTTVQKAYGTDLVQNYASYTYSANGKQKSVTDANGNRAELAYDGHDRQSHWYFPSKTAAGQVDYSNFEQYDYDANGNRTLLRKRDGSTLTYHFDALNRMTAKIVPERAGLSSTHTRDVYYEYDLRGLQTKARFDSLAGEGITSEYDGFGRLTLSSSNMGGVARAVGNGYDANGKRIRITHPDGSFFTYDQDGLDRPTLVRENGGDPIASFTYDRAGRRARSGWAAATDYAYNPAGRLQSLSHDLAGTTRDHVLGFTYNPAGQVVTRSASNDAYAWGGAANTSRPYAVNGLNQYTSAGSATFGYDPNGNLASTVNAPWSTAYVYDVENRLVSASGTHNAELVYDPLGRLFQVSSGGAGIRRMVYDGDALVAEYEPGGSMVHRYIHGNDAGADDPLVWYDNWNSGWRRGLVADHQGSIIQVADMYGNPIATNSYDPWGLPGANNAGRFGYTGQAWVPELGLWYYKARFYSPTLGRFLQVDPIGYDDQVNLYAYVGNDPVNKMDPSGECGTSGRIWGCVVTGRQSGTGFRSPQVRPNDYNAINNHARYGDGSPREVDFALVELTDLGGSLQALAGRAGTSLNTAIAQARRSGGPVAIHMTEILAGGGIGGRTSIGQQGGIGRFSVTMDGTVRATRDGRWTMDATVTGETDRQDYPSSNRNWFGERITDYGRLRQWMGGGQDYDINFRGSQNINVMGRVW